MTYALEMHNFNGNMKDELEGARKTRVVFIFLILKTCINWGTTYTQ